MYKFLGMYKRFCSNDFLKKHVQMIFQYFFSKNMHKYFFFQKVCTNDFFFQKKCTNDFSMIFLVPQKIFF